MFIYSHSHLSIHIHIHIPPAGQVLPLSGLATQGGSYRENIQVCWTSYTDQFSLDNFFLFNIWYPPAQRTHPPPAQRQHIYSSCPAPLVCMLPPRLFVFGFGSLVIFVMYMLDSVMCFVIITRPSITSALPPNRCCIKLRSGGTRRCHLVAHTLFY